MNPELFFAFLFWFSLAALAYTFCGYPILIFFLARFRGKPVQKKKTFTTVSVVLAAHNEEQRISTRIQNLLAADYPKNNFEIIVVSDGSTDATAEKVKNLADPRVRSIELSSRNGKAHCLNLGVKKASGEIIVFGDVRQRFASDAISRLVSHFADESVGAVSGSLEIEKSASNIGGAVDAYWRLEKFIRFSESKLDSAIGCTGAIYAIRRDLFQPIPSDTLLDDVIIPMQIAAQKFRVLFDPTALAYDPQSLEPQREKIRKQRTLAGNYQMFFRYPGWTLPWRSRLWWQLISHKYLRLAAPFLMLLLLASNAALWNSPFYQILLVGQCAFYCLAICGAFFRKVKTALLSIPAGFVFLNLMSLDGLRHYLRGSYRQGSWPTNRG